MKIEKLEKEMEGRSIFSNFLNYYLIGKLKLLIQ